MGAIKKLRELLRNMFSLFFYFFFFCGKDGEIIC